MKSPALRIAIVAGWVVTVFWEIATLRAVNIQDDVFASDLLSERLPLRVFLGETLRRGEWPLWIPGIYTGIPFLNQVEGTLYAPNLLLFGLLPPWVAAAWSELLPLVVVGAGTSLLAGRYGLSLAPSLLAGGSMAVSGFFVSHFRHLNMIEAACWLPWLLLSIEKLIATGAARHAVAIAILWALSLFAAHPQISYYTALFAPVYFLARSRQAERDRGKRAIAWLRGIVSDRRSGVLVLAFAIGTLLAAVQLVPGAEYASLGRRSGGLSTDAASEFPVSPRSLLGFFDPYANGDVADGTYDLSAIFWEQYGYLGLLPALLALFGAAAAWRDPPVRVWAATAVVSLLLVLGPNTPLFPLALAVVPGMSYFRFPSRFLLFADLAVALLAAFGLSRFLRASPKRPIRAFVAVVVIGATAADLWIHQRRQVPLVEWSEWTAPVESVEVLRTLSSGLREPWRAFSLDAEEFHQDLYERSAGWWGDLSRYVAARDLLEPNRNLRFGIESPDGYVPLPPRHHWEISRLVRRAASAGGEVPPHVELVLRLFNVRYVLAAWPLRAPAFVERAATKTGVRIYELPSALPRAFVVGRGRPVASDEEAATILRGGWFDPAEEALIHDRRFALPDDARSSTSVRVLERSSTRLRAEATLERPGLFVLSEAYYPGWQATVNGRAAEILRANLVMRALPLAAGRNVVEFEFRSPAVRTGAVLSFLGLVALLGVAWVGRPRGASGGPDRMGAQAAPLAISSRNRV